MPQDPPKVGTKEWAEWVCSHFTSLVEAMRDMIGDEVFRDSCAFSVGVKFMECNEKCTCGKHKYGMIVNARGNIEISIRMMADLMDLAAINIHHQYKKEGCTYESALAKVLQDVKNELVNTQREAIK